MSLPGELGTEQDVGPEAVYFDLAGLGVPLAYTAADQLPDCSDHVAHNFETTPLSRALQ